ncbi:MAG: methyltransferase domain-containing protein [Gemmatimonadota bacterium]|nr:MAG: methyltransferase domain-containing protein [Gemmatimonadota bacterium]
MAREDRERWDQRYRAGDWADLREPARIVLDAEAWLDPPGLVLDLACGAGRNSLHLARRGFSVVAVDISWEGLQRLARRSRERRLSVYPIHADLDRFALPTGAFDVIINARFLLRSLFPKIRGALRAGGLLLFETFSTDEIDVLGGDIRRPFALEPGELRAAFADYELLLYEEGIFDEPEGERGLVRMIARRPAAGPAT